jgi:hypothetical protein
MKEGDEKMVKQTQRVITQGIQHLEQTYDISELFYWADKFHTDEQYFISFKKNGNVEDGNGNVLAKMDNPVSEVVYAIRDDYDTHYVVTLLLSYEY